MISRRQLAETWSTFGRHSAAYVVGEAAGKGLTFLILIGLAVLTAPADFGYLNLFITLLGLAGVVVAFGIPDGVLRFFFSDRELSTVIRGGATLIAAAAILVVVATFALDATLARLLRLPEWLVTTAGVAAPAVAGRQLWLAVLRAEERSRAYAWVRALEPVLTVLVLVVIWVLFRALDYRGLIVSFVSGPVIVGLIGLIVLGIDSGFRPTVQPARELIAYSMPLMPHAVAMTGLATIDQVVVNQLLGPEATGEYALAYRFAMAMYLLAFGISAAWAPKVFMTAAEDGGDELPRIAETATTVSLILALVLCVVLPSTAIALGANRSAAALIPIIVYGYVWFVLYSLVVPYLIMDGNTLKLASASGSALLVNVALNYLLIPSLGILGAAAATVISFFSLFALVWYMEPMARRRLPVTALSLRSAALLPPVLGLWFFVR